jgi:hypothetical protein
MQPIALLIVADPGCPAHCYANSLLLDWPPSWSPWGATCPKFNHVSVADSNVAMPRMTPEHRES